MRKVKKNPYAEQIIRKEFGEDLNNGKEIRKFFLKIVNSQVRDSHEAEDIANTALFNIWKKAGTYDMHKYPIDTSIPILEDKKFRTWGLAIVKNAIRDYARDKSRFRKKHVLYSDYSSENNSLLEEKAVSNEDFISSIIESENKEIISKTLRGFISELSWDLRNVIEIFYYNGKKYKEIAEELGTPIETIKSRIAKAKGILEKKLKESSLLVNCN